MGVWFYLAVVGWLFALAGVVAELTRRREICHLKGIIDGHLDLFNEQKRVFNRHRASNARALATLYGIEMKCQNGRQCIEEDQKELPPTPLSVYTDMLSKPSETPS